jgi:hypothetical protein
MPFACLGIVGFSYLSRPTERGLAAVVVVLTGAYSFAVNLMGALRGAMGCPHGQNAFWNHVATWGHGEKLSYPLASWLFLPLLLCVTLFALNIIANMVRSPTVREG